MNTNKTKNKYNLCQERHFTESYNRPMCCTTDREGEWKGEDLQRYGKITLHKNWISTREQSNWSRPCR